MSPPQGFEGAVVELALEFDGCFAKEGEGGVEGDSKSFKIETPAGPWVLSKELVLVLRPKLLPSSLLCLLIRCSSLTAFVGIVTEAVERLNWYGWSGGLPPRPILFPLSMLSPTESERPGWNRAVWRELGIVFVFRNRNEGLELSERVKEGSPPCSMDAEEARGGCVVCFGGEGSGLLFAFDETRAAAAAPAAAA